MGRREVNQGGGGREGEGREGVWGHGERARGGGNWS